MPYQQSIIASESEITRSIAEECRYINAAMCAPDVAARNFVLERSYRKIDMLIGALVLYHGYTEYAAINLVGTCYTAFIPSSKVWVK